MFGLGPSARVFTKVLRAAILFLRNEFGIEICGYIDDHLIQADVIGLSYQHTEIAILTFHCLGFAVNFPKSVLTPTQQLPHLGFLWDTVEETVTLPAEKVEGIVALVAGYRAREKLTADRL